jgi:hypothetical protein
MVLLPIGLAGAMGLIPACGNDSPRAQTESVTQALSISLVIAQIYPGGGDAGAPFKHDFVVIFNRGASPVSLGGVKLQYASSLSNFTNTSTSGVSAREKTQKSEQQPVVVSCKAA